MRIRTPFTTLFLAFALGAGAVTSTALGTPAFKCVLQEISKDSHSPEKSGERVSAPVPGLYESIPTQHEVAVGPLKIQIHHKNFADVFFNGTKAGQFTLSYSPDKRTFYFGGTFLKGAPSFINAPGVTPLVANRGVPTQAFASLMLMKSFGIKYGELAHVETSAVENLRTSIQMIQSPAYKKWLKERPTPYPTREVLEEALQGSHTVSYIETVLNQSGHKITKVRINDAEIKWIPLRQMLLEHQDDVSDSIRALLYDRDSAGNPVQISLDQLVPVSFAVEMDLAPFSH